ncbi:MAG: hypothetical protein QM809_04675 [Gordonia sp. (in: high G+C Gram-positive bacteria)]|uniref:hypothetical protein n=1 Tax=Gordonia sp. (in: high G+C Gram-positive bacteria) TaxID=84139 RepID=UPI0039E49DD4
MPLDMLAVGYDVKVRDLVRELELRGTPVTLLRDLDASPSGASVLVLVLDEALESSTSEESVRRFADRYGDVIPVTSRPAGTPEYFAELSHLLLTQVPVSESAATITEIAAIGGSRIVEWNRLLDRAREWSEDPAHTALLTEPEVQSAELLLAEGVGFFDRTAVDMVVNFVETSKAAIAKRRRTGISVLSAGALALVVLIVLAVVQALNANDSREHADEARQMADADRLADYAIRMQDADPDLPSILVKAAAKVKPTDRVIGAANSIAERTWPHRSVRLDGLPLRMGRADAAPRIAIGTEGATEVRVFDTEKAVEIAALQVGKVDDLVAVAMNPVGSTVAVQGRTDNEIRLYPVDGGGARQMKAPEKVKLLGWYEPDRLAVATAERLAVISASGGALTTVLEIRKGEELRAFATSGDGAVTAAISVDALYLLRRGTAPVRVPVKGAMDVAVAESGDLIAVAGHPSNTMVRWPRGGKPEAQTTAEAERGTKVVRIDDGFAFASWDGRVLAPGAKTEVLAHAGGRFLAQMAGRNSLVTAGQDRYVRFWTPRMGDASAVPLPFGLSDMRSAAFRPGTTSSLLESTRNQITLQPGAEVATVIHQPNYLWTVNATDRTAIKKTPTYFGRLNADMALSPGGTAAVRVVSGGLNFGRIGWDGDLTDGGVIEGKPIGMTIASTGRGLVAVDDDASTAILADSTHLSCWSKAGGSPNRIDRTFDADRAPMALIAGTVDGRPECRALTADGYVRDQTGHEEKISIPGVAEGDVRLSAGAFQNLQGTIVAVTDSGDIYEITRSAVRRVGGTGPGTRPFAVRVSPSGKTIAVMGRAGSSYIDRASGRELRQVPAVGTSYISDVAFRLDSGSNALLTITSMGAVGSLSLTSDCEGALCNVIGPRPATSRERADFHIPAGTGE